MEIGTSFLGTAQEWCPKSAEAAPTFHSRMLQRRESAVEQQLSGIKGRTVDFCLRGQGRIMRKGLGNIVVSTVDILIFLGRDVRVDLQTRIESDGAIHW